MVKPDDQLQIMLADVITMVEDVKTNMCSWASPVVWSCHIAVFIASLLD